FGDVGNIDGHAAFARLHRIPVPLGRAALARIDPETLEDEHARQGHGEQGEEDNAEATDRQKAFHAGSHNRKLAAGHEHSSRSVTLTGRFRRSNPSADISTTKWIGS